MLALQVCLCIWVQISNPVTDQDIDYPNTWRSIAPHRYRSLRRAGDRAVSFESFRVRSCQSNHDSPLEKATFPSHFLLARASPDRGKTLSRRCHAQVHIEDRLVLSGAEGGLILIAIEFPAWISGAHSSREAGFGWVALGSFDLSSISQNLLFPGNFEKI